MTPDDLADRSVYLELNRNESRIIAERLRAMLTFHGLLFAAVGVSAGQRLFVLALLLAFVGALFCWPWYREVLLSYDGTAKIGSKYKLRKPADAPGLDAYNIEPEQFRLLPEVFLPRAIAVTWVLVFIVIIYYWAYPPSLPTKS